MKTQLLQDICESASRSRSRLLDDALFPDAQRSEPEAQAQSGGPEPTEEAAASPFASERVDWSGGQTANEPHWFDRWGRPAATWSAGLALVCFLAGSGLWLYQENRIDSTLVLVAKNSLPSRQAVPSSVTPAPASTTATAAKPDALQEWAGAPREAVMQAAAPSAETPGLATSSTSEPVASNPLPLKQNRVSTKSRAKAPDSPVEPEATRTGQLAEMLKQCRAMGYHAEQCLKRGCIMTRYGLACKG